MNSPESAEVPQRNSSGRAIFAVQLAIAGIAVTAISCLAGQFWIADLFAQFKLHWAAGLMVVMLFLAMLRRWKWFVACAVALAINLIPVWPYLFRDAPIRSNLGAVHVNSTDVANPRLSADYRLLSLNVLTKNRDHDGVISLIEDEQADFVVLLEINARWKTVLEPLNATYPFSQFESREDNFGIAFLSKHPWDRIEVFESETHQLPSIDVSFDSLSKNGVPAPGAPGTNGVSLRLIATHPIPPLSELNTLARNEQLIDVARRFKSTSRNLMVGDFNLTPWSPMFAQVLAQGGLKDSARGFNVTPTWYVFPTWIGGLKIDHVLCGPGITCVDHRVGPDVGSDHRAVVLDFRWAK